MSRFFFFVFFQSPCKRLKISHHSVHPGSTIVEGCNWEGVAPGPAAPVPSPEAVSKLAVKASVRDLRFRNPVCFRAGNIHNFITRWEEVLTGQEKRAEILSYLRDGVDVNSFFAPYKGDFQGKFYDSPIPPSACFPNSKSCEEFTDFISSTISQRLANGSISVWGKVGECTPPYLVMPLTVEPTKPRLCHDERFLNLWVKDSPFTLDYISNLPRYVGKDSFQTTIDDKSGYDHVRLAENSRKFFGLQWQGVYYLYHTIPFGWKASAYIYHTIGMGATSYIRSLGVPCSQYIDDRHVGQLTTCRKSPKSTTAWSDFELADAAAFIAAAVLISLGYFISLAKSSLLPKRIVKFLGFLIDSQRCAFILPEDKKRKFAALRESILDKKSSSIKTLQRLAGKITSFCIAVPVAQLYCREIFKATAGYKKSARPVKIHSLLREEIEHWRFLDSWEGTLPWPSERHIVLEILSDASDYAWGGVIRSPGAPPVTIRDYWTASTRLSPIVVKEALALVNVLSAGEHLISNARVDAYTDNTAFIHSWGKQGGKNTELNSVLKSLYDISLRCNSHIKLYFTPSARNPADAPSRVLSDKDCKLSAPAWSKVQQAFGPHTIDLMSLDSNVQFDEKGVPLRHFTPFYTPMSSGINVFAQVISRDENAYVFPPFVMMGPLLKFLLQARITVTIIAPQLSPIPYWWPILKGASSVSLLLGSKGEGGVILFPSPHVCFATRPLQWDLFAFRFEP